MRIHCVDFYGLLFAEFAGNHKIRKMKKITLALSVVFAFAFASCQKCIECTYEAAGQKVSSGDICGKKSEIEDAKKTWENTGKTYGVTTTCMDK